METGGIVLEFRRDIGADEGISRMRETFNDYGSLIVVRQAIWDSSPKQRSIDFFSNPVGVIGPP